MENSDHIALEPDVAAKGERIIVGIPAAPGVAVGKAYVYEREDVYVAERQLREDEIQLEIDLLHEAVARAEEELRDILAFAREKLSDDLSAIFEGQILMLKDEEVLKTIQRKVKIQKRNVDFVIHEEVNKYKSLLITTGNESARDRIADIEDVGHRLLRNLHKKRLHYSIEGEHIIVASMLSPADTLLFSASDVLAYAMDMGSVTSHAAILARSLRTPAVVGLHELTANVETGDTVIVDGTQGKVIVNPSPERLKQYELRIAEQHRIDSALDRYTQLPAVTPDGHQVRLVANAELVQELDYLLTQGAQGIGLYRTEHLCMNKGDFPSEEEQIIAYTEVALALHPHPVIFRTFDIGGDKFAATKRVEANPFLGWRGIRIMLDKPDIFQAQLRAILRASVLKNVKMIFPMISGLYELREALGHLEQVRCDLREQGVVFDENMEIGIMVEVPSAVMIADLLADEVDFFSIGTNDLIQYLIAVDRNNDLIAELYQEFHPAVLRAIRHVIDTAHQKGKWTGMCGQMASNPAAVAVLLGLGLDEFSVVPSALGQVKQVIRETPMADAQSLAAEVMSINTAVEIKEFVAAWLADRFPDIHTLTSPEIPFHGTPKV